MHRTVASQSRTQDTREKIQLGGLIVKAGLDRETPAVLLGLLIDARRRMDADTGERARLAALGAVASGAGAFGARALGKGAHDHDGA